MRIVDEFFPMSEKELRQQGIGQPDFIIVTGDAYVDHPAFGAAIIGRVLQSQGFSVGIIAQPRFTDCGEFTKLGRPRLAFLVTSGNLDSMVNNYSVTKHKRARDVYSPGGKAGGRPDHAVIVYANRVKEAYKNVPVIIGGLEASLRRFAHYDYWNDRVRHSILVDSGAELLIYGMGERAIMEVAEALASGIPIKEISYVNGSCYIQSTLENVYDYKSIESYTDVASNKEAYARAFMQQAQEHDAFCGSRLVQAHEKGYVVANPPALPLTQRELDAVYALPYARRAHPVYREPIPALSEVQFSLASSRGCFGGCSFCALTYHQGRIVQGRSHESLLDEAKLLTGMCEFKGNIHDVGGPTANFRIPACKKQISEGVCKAKQCIGYKHCEKLIADHTDYISLLRKLRALPNIKKVFVRSGIRYDYIIYDPKSPILNELVQYHISGQLKVAPEHVNDQVLFYMNKPPHAMYERFVKKYEALNIAQNKDQFIVPYYISSHPGSDINAAVELAEYLKKSGQRPEQVQDFYPTPGTLATCMYYTGIDPRTMKPVYVARSLQEKGRQRALMQYFIPANFHKVREALKSADREDLIGYHKKALVPPENKTKGTGRKAGR